MSKSVLISIQPKWCELIASGRKTIEVRKTKPKIPTPFKVYIYCTKARIPIRHNGGILMYEDDLAITNRWGQGKRVENPCGAMMDGELFLNGKVIGEFVCDEIYDIGYSPYNHGGFISNIDGYLSNTDDLYKKSCLDLEKMFNYLSQGYGYGWHISDLKIYDKPKELSEFVMPSKIGCCNEGKCKGCKWLDMGNGFNIEDDCFAPFDTDEYKPLRRPPQSWCYVERLVGEE